MKGRGGGDLWRNSHELGAAKGHVVFVFRPQLDFFSSPGRPVRVNNWNI